MIKKKTDSHTPQVIFILNLLYFLDIMSDFSIIHLTIQAAKIASVCMSELKSCPVKTEQLAQSKLVT